MSEPAAGRDSADATSTTVHVGHSIRPIHHRRQECRACGATTLRLILSLGPQPLANAFLSSPDAPGEETYPLDVHLCESCSLVQVLDVVDPEVLFREYIYVTGTSTTIAAHNAHYARTVVELLHLNRQTLVVEAASNDGSLLECFQAEGVRTLGIEPARNIAHLARNRGVETIDRFFDETTAASVRASHGAARAVIGNNVLAHVDNTLGFLSAATVLLEDAGLLIVEVPYLGEFVDRLEYDTVYHEHLCYFSLTALMRLCEAVGLRIIRVDRYPVHGGSIRMYAGLARRYPEHAAAVKAMALEEAAQGLTTFPRFARFAQDVARNRDQLLDLLSGLREEGKTVAGYGAPAKGNTLLNYCRIGPELLPYTVDRSPLKVGKFTPGMHIPVLPVGTLLDRQPDFVLILAWNFAGEIMAQQEEYRRRGGRFIVPIPDPTVY